MKQNCRFTGEVPNLAVDFTQGMAPAWASMVATALHATISGKRNLDISRKSAIKLRWLVALLLFALGHYGVRTGVAQTANAAISGHITDPTGAVVPGATVILTASDTRVATRTTSNGEGLYTFPSVKPGNYSMSVSEGGFRTTTITGLTAVVQGSLSRNVVLEIGAATQTVNVT